MIRAAFDSKQAFPPLPMANWKSTKNTLHLYLQIIGKIRLEMHPPINHWWHVTLYVSPRGLTTRAIPFGLGNFEIEFDFKDHKLKITTNGGERREFNLEDGLSVAEFYKNVFENLSSLGITPKIKAIPYEAPSKTPFAENTQDKSYDKEYIERFHRVLVTVNDIFEEFRGRFTGKSTPVHVFWHSFDLALTRFSGRPGKAREGAGMVEREPIRTRLSALAFGPVTTMSQRPRFILIPRPNPQV